MACGYVLQVGLLLESAESQTTRPDDVRLSNQDTTRTSPLLEATDLGARTLDDGRYLLLALAFRERFLASQYSSMERRTFTVLVVCFDISPGACYRNRYLAKSSSILRVGVRWRFRCDRTGLHLQSCQLLNGLCTFKTPRLLLFWNPD